MIKAEIRAARIQAISTNLANADLQNMEPHHGLEHIQETQGLKLPHIQALKPAVVTQLQATNWMTTERLPQMPTVRVETRPVATPVAQAQANMRIPQASYAREVPINNNEKDEPGQALALDRHHYRIGPASTSRSA